MTDALDEYVARRRRRRSVLVVLGLLLAGAGAWAWVNADQVRSWLRGPNLRLEAALAEPSESIHNGVELRSVHAELLPAWWLPVSNRERSGALGQAQNAADALADALEPDPELSARFAALRGATQGDVWENATAVREAARAWSDHLDGLGAPWFIEATVLKRRDRAVLLVKSYEVLADVSVDVGGAGQRVRLMRRVDGTNVVEGFLGHSGEEGRGALVTVDRLTQFTADVVWPMLDPAVERKDPVESAYAAAVREEAEAALSPAHFGLLQDSAATRARLLRTVERVHERRHCHGATIYLDWLGLAGQTLAWARAESRDNSRDVCPVFFPVEADVLLEDSNTLQSTRGLDDAFGALLAWVSRGTAAHEARHIADGRFLRGADDAVEELPCPGCPPDFPVGARSELSAYLAAFATPGVARTQLLQACRTATRTLGGRHFAAMELIATAWDLQGCRVPPPDDVVQQARELESALFQRDAPVTLPADYPSQLEPAFNNNKVGG